MKTCQNCKLNYKAGNFCSKCGQPLTDAGFSLQSHSPIEMTDQKVESTPFLTNIPAINNESEQPVVHQAESTSTYVNPFLTSVPSAEPESIPQVQIDSPSNVEMSVQPFMPHNLQNDKISENNKSKQKKKASSKAWLAIVGVLVLFFIVFAGGTLYYLGHSEVIVNNLVRNNSKEGFKVVDLLMESVEGEKIDIKLSYRNIKPLIDNQFKFEKTRVLGFFETEEVYFDSDEKKVVVSVSSPLGSTSLILEPNIEVEREKITVSLKSPKLGSWRIPLPEKIIEVENFRWVFEQSKFVFATIDSITLENNHIHIKGKTDVEKINQMFLEVRKQSDPFAVEYINDEESKRLPAYELILTYEENGNWKDIIFSWLKYGYDVPNWLYFVKNENLEDYLKFQSLIYSDDVNQKVQKNVQKVLESKDELEEKYQKYREERLRAQMIEDAAILFQNAYSYHKEKGVPAYFLASKGKLYSQTLREYITMDKLKPNSDNRWDGYEIYAYGTEAIVALNFQDQVWYIKESSKDNILDKPKKEFLKGIKYDPNYANGDFLLRRGDSTRTEIAKVISANLGVAVSGDVFIQYLAADGNFAFAIASPDYARQQPEQFFLQKVNGKWQLMRKFSERESIRSVMSKEIGHQNFNVCILPPFETADFQRNYLGEYDLRTYEWAYYYETGYDKAINYYSSVGGNTVITFDADSKFLYVNGKRYHVLKSEKSSEYYQYLNPHGNYSNYRPTYIFYQD